jgi:hypothetical protein
MQATPQTDTVSPVTVADFAAFIGASAADPLLPGLLQAATDAAIRCINQDLLPRAWVGIVPALTPTRLQLSPYIDPSSTFELPYTALISVQEVTGNDTQVLEYEVEADRRPAKVKVLGWDYMSEIRIEYTAGMPFVPGAIRTAIMMIGGFIYDHRGGCDADDAVKKSGAMTLLRPYKVEASL